MLHSLAVILGTDRVTNFFDEGTRLYVISGVAVRQHGILDFDGFEMLCERHTVRRNDNLLLRSLTGLDDLDFVVGIGIDNRSHTVLLLSLLLFLLQVDMRLLRGKPDLFLGQGDDAAPLTIALVGTDFSLFKALARRLVGLGVDYALYHDFLTAVGSLSDGP